MSYQIPFGGCSCGNSNINNSSGGEGGGFFGAPLPSRVYKNLTSADRTVSVEDNMVAELDLSSVSDFPEKVILPTVYDFVGRKKNYDKIANYFLSYYDDYKTHYNLCFCSLPHLIGTGIYDSFLSPSWGDYDEEGFSEQEKFMRTKPTAYEFWTKLVSIYYERRINSDWGEITPDDDYAFLKVRDHNGNLLEYSLVDYLRDFPDMMNMDEIRSYLSSLAVYGFLVNREYVLVPLTDRIYIHEPISDIEPYNNEVCLKSYVYLARFRIYYNGGYRVEYIDTCGAYTSGNSIYVQGIETENQALVFCQKRILGFEILDIPITAPKDFNSINRATIKVKNIRYCYLNLVAEGYDFLPLQGNIPLESTNDGFIVPLDKDYAGTTDGAITIETINKNGRGTFLITAIFHGRYMSQIYTADRLTDYQEHESLDWSNANHIYSSR